MTALALSLLTQFWPFILGGVAIVAGWVYRGHSVRKDERAKQAQAELRARHQADEVEDAIAGRSADENRGRLGKWVKK